MTHALESDKKIPPTESGAAKTVAAGVFKAKCLQLLDEVAETREPLIVTKFGKPVAQIVERVHPGYYAERHMQNPLEQNGPRAALR